MSLISLLIALASERMVTSKTWRFNHYFLHYLQFALKFVSKYEISKSRVNLLAFAAIPAIAVWALLAFIDSSLVTFVTSTLLLVVCIGCSSAKESYKGFLNAAMRGDDVALDYHQLQLQRNQQFTGESFGQSLIWANFQYFMMIIMLYIVFGIVAVVFYRVLLALHSQVKNDDEQPVLDESCSKKVTSLLEVIEFIPARFAAFGYMLVGHFSKASTYWLEGLLNTQISSRQYLCMVAKSSEEYEIAEGDLTAEPSLLVRLAKRNLLLLLAAIAFMTLAGVIS
ncbi:regulatory signaling modulator protein AmpE [Thalassotalea maritima]|uniref:regulatory signaling modulator protein AmpE n=1 Tax=Thalassotalea maritima TaxID=3242416 RepID=UPI003528AC9D